MEKKTKIKLGIAATIVSGIAYLAFWGVKKKAFADSLVVIQSIKVVVLTKKSFLGISIPWTMQLVVSPTIKNPSNGDATITQPYVEMRFSETDLAPFTSSQVSGAEIEIASMSEVVFDGVGKNPQPIILPINTSDLLSSAKSILLQAIKTKKLSLFTLTKTSLVTLAGKLPIAQPDKVEMKF